MNGKMRGLVTGLLTMAVSRAQFPKGEPVAYLYNGVRLPKLPEWDKEMYPLAVIARGENEQMLGETFHLTAISEISYCVVDGDSHWLRKTDEMSYVQYKVHTFLLSRDGALGMEAGVWIDTGEEETTYTDVTRLVWSNFDIITFDDVLLHEESPEPIPVYE